MTNQVIFSGAPSQACNLPALLKGSAVMAVIGGIHVCASSAFPFQWPVLLAQAGAVLVGVSMPFVKTAFTRIVIDSERIDWTQGILRRRVSTLELARIQSVTSVSPWWQRPFGIGSIFLGTDDAAHPVRRLPGIKGVAQLREKLEEAVALRRAGLAPTDPYGPNAPDYSRAHRV